MTKVQKTLLAALMAITLLPEIIYQSTCRLIAGVITLQNITFGEPHRLVLAQSLSALITSVLLISWRKKFITKWRFWTLVTIFVIWALAAFVAYYDALYARVEFRGF